MLKGNEAGGAGMSVAHGAHNLPGAGHLCVLLP